MRTGLALALLLVVALLAVLWSRERPTIADPGSTAAEEIATPAPIAPPADVQTPAERKAVPGAEAPRPGGQTAAPRITVRGRCVDADGTPLAGVTATLTGRWRHPARRDWPQVAPQTTAADGAFAFRIEPRQRWAFELILSAAKHVGARGTWRGLEQDTDLGDITMRLGCVVHGRVVDTRGTPQVGIGIYLSPKVRPTEVDGLGPWPFHFTRSGDDGSFRLPPTPPGAKRLTLRHAIRRSPTGITVAAQVAEHTLEIVVECADDWPSIRGVVVDQDHQPLPGVKLSTSPNLLRFTIRHSGDRGAFTIMKPAKGPSGPFRLHATKLGYAALDSKQEHDWGAEGLRLVMTRLPGVHLQVTDGTRGIEDYSVWITEAPGFRRSHWVQYERIRNKGRHPDGATVVDGLLDGDYLLKVLPAAMTWLESDFTPVHIGPGPAPRLLIEIGRSVQRDVIVRWTGGEPIHAAKVELLETLDGSAVTATTETFRHGSPINQGRAYARSVQRTERRGAAQLRGPQAGNLTLRVTGAGFPAVILPGVDLTVTEPLVVEIDRPATITGRIRPAKLLQQIRAMLPPDAPAQPGLSLRRGPRNLRERIPTVAGTSIPFDADGEFSFAAVPPGTWELFLHYVAGSSGVTVMHALPLGQVLNLRRGERRRHDLDLGHLVFASVSLQVYVDSKPYDGKSLYLDAGSSGANLDVDESGRFKQTLPPGRYRVQVYFDRVRATADGILDLQPGQQVTRTFHVRTRPVVLHVVGADDKRRANVRLHIGQARGRVSLPPTDADRDRTLRLAPGKFQLWAMPKGAAGGWSKHVKVAEIEVRAGEQPQQIRIELPDSLGY